MSRWFYSAWALAVLLAFVLPVAIPYAVWPTGGRLPASRGVLDAETFGELARYELWSQGEFRFYPKSVRGIDPGIVFRDGDTRTCGVGRGGALVDRRYTAEVTFRGPYGISLTSFEVTCSGWSRTGRMETEILALILSVLLATVAVVSTPFAFFWLRHLLRRRLEPAT